MSETPSDNSSAPPRLRPPSPRHRRLTPRDDVADKTGMEVHAVMQELPDDRLNEEQLKIILDALNGMQFKGKNPSFEDYSRQSPWERGDSVGAIERENSDWINTAFAATPDTYWIKVENGNVTTGGGRNSMPDDIDMYEEGKSRGVIPFVFRRQEDTETKYYSDYQRERIKYPHVVNDLSRFVEIVRQLDPGESALFIDRYSHNIDTQVRGHVAPCEPNRDSFGDHMELFLEEQTGKKVNVGRHIMDGRIDAGGFEHDLDSFGYLVTVIQ